MDIRTENHSTNEVNVIEAQSVKRTITPEFGGAGGGKKAGVEKRRFST